MPKLMISETNLSIEERTLTTDEIVEMRGYKKQLEDANATIKTLQDDLAILMGDEAKPKNEILET